MLSQERLTEMNSFYRFPSFRNTDLVIDIGTNSGDFILGAIEYGARDIEGYEISKKSFDNCMSNVPDYVRLYHKAVWRSDIKEDIKYSSQEEGHETLSLIIKKALDTPIESISLDDIIGEREIDFIKMDCEGAEYPILYTAKLLHKVKRLVVEVHNFTDPGVTIYYKGIDQGLMNSVSLREFIISQGFDVEPFPLVEAGVDFIYATNINR